MVGLGVLALLQVDLDGTYLLLRVNEKCLVWAKDRVCVCGGGRVILYGGRV